MIDDIVIDVEARENDARIIVRGALDITTAGVFATAVQVDLANCEKVTVDLSELDFMDSSGLVALLAAYERYGEALTIVYGPSLEPLVRHSGAASFLPMVEHRSHEHRQHLHQPNGYPRVVRRA